MDIFVFCPQEIVNKLLNILYNSIAVLVLSACMNVDATKSFMWRTRLGAETYPISIGMPAQIFCKYDEQAFKMIVLLRLQNKLRIRT